jgi:hypothetical protein
MLAVDWPASKRNGHWRRKKVNSGSSSYVPTKATSLCGNEAGAPQDGFFHGARNGRLVVVGPINLPVGRLFVEEVITECRKRGASRADVLAFEFEMGLFPAVLDEARGKGIDLAPKYIPVEVFDKRAVEKGQVVFHDITFVEATPRYDRKRKLVVAIELTDFSVYYTQGSAEAAIANMKGGKESFYKCQYQFAKEWLDFTSVRVTVEGDRWRVSPASSGSLDWIRDSFSGRFAFANQRVHTSMVVRAAR